MRYLIILLVVLFAVSGVSRAEMVAGRQMDRAEDVVQDMSNKLCRGVFNILTGWGEIPRQMIKSGHDRGWWAVIPVGIPSGIIMGVGRTGIGVVETLLFYVPVDDGYEAILEPDFVWQ